MEMEFMLVTCHSISFSPLPRLAFLSLSAEESSTHSLRGNHFPDLSSCLILSGGNSRVPRISIQKDVFKFGPCGDVSPRNHRYAHPLLCSGKHAQIQYTSTIHDYSHG